MSRRRLIPRQSESKGGRARVAFVTHHEQGEYNSFTLSQFERDDLAALKDSARITWDPREQEWIVGWEDAPDLHEMLNELGYIVRCSVA